MKEPVKGALLGLAVGDALGVPVEFQDRDELEKYPVVGMKGYGTHNQLPGTWSDDSSLAFCLAESLSKGYDLRDIANTMVAWLVDKRWTPYGTVFDIGFTTRSAIYRLKSGEKPHLSGEFDEESNGNGSLMRILPLAFYLLDKPVQERYRIVKEVSSITHAHIRSVLACFIYIEFAIHLIKGKGKAVAYSEMQRTVNDFIANSQFNSQEIRLFDRILQQNIYSYYKAEIRSSGYVLHTLEASLWCLLHHTDYASTVLTAVNLGGDTDTTGAVTGGLAGILYGYEGIPGDWVNQLARKEDIVTLADQVSSSPAVPHLR